MDILCVATDDATNLISRLCHKVKSVAVGFGIRYPPITYS